MDLKRKLELLADGVKSISRHDDEDAAVRHAALNLVDAIVKAEREGIDARVAARVAASLGQVAKG
jgi:hypothetical protein